MRRSVRVGFVRRSVWAACLGLLTLPGCGKESLEERLAGMYATDAVQADLDEHAKGFVSDDLFGRFDHLDQQQAAEEGSVWARLRLHPDGRFEYEGPAADETPPDARLRGRWKASAAFVELTVERAAGTDAESLPKTLTCSTAPGGIDLPFLTDPASRRPLRLSKR